MPTQSTATDQSRDKDERNWWDLWNTSFRSEDNRDETSTELFAHVAAIVQQIAEGHTSRILEIGCGTGTLSRLLSFSSYHGLDFSPAAIDIARQKAELTPRPKGGNSPTYEVTDFHEWPLRQDSYDVAVCVDAVAYFRDQQFALKKIAQCLCANGRLVLTTINPFVYHRIRRTPERPMREGAVSHWLSRGELHALIATAGLKVERSYTIMPRGQMGLLRLINARRVNQAFGPHVAAALRRLKERSGLGQYRILVARKD